MLVQKLTFSCATLLQQTDIGYCLLDAHRNSNEPVLLFHAVEDSSRLQIIIWLLPVMYGPATPQPVNFFV